MRAYVKYILNFSLLLRIVNGGLAHPDSYREVRAFDNFDLFFIFGGLAQLARAFDWQSKGQGFDSPNLHLRPPNPPAGGEGGPFLLMEYVSR
jgi:hypothetical protein